MFLPSSSSYYRSSISHFTSVNLKPSISHLNLMHVTDGAGSCQKGIFFPICIMVVAPIQWFEKSWRSIQIYVTSPSPRKKIYMGLMEASQWLQRMWLHFPFKWVSISWATIIYTGGWSSTCRIWRPPNFLASPTRWTWVWVNSGSGDGQGGLACCNSWGHKESDMTEWLNWTETFWRTLRMASNSSPSGTNSSDFFNH